jgi:hypothetical protein
MPRQSFAGTMADWERLLAAVTANQDALPYIAAYKQQLEVEMAGARVAVIRQAASQAEAQQASRDVDGFLARGEDLATRIRAGIKIKYGSRSEKLKEFGLKVFRGRKKVTNLKRPPAASPKEGAQEGEAKQALGAATTEDQDTT